MHGLGLNTWSVDLRFFLIRTPSVGILSGDVVDSKIVREVTITGGGNKFVVIWDGHIKCHISQFEIVAKILLGRIHRRVTCVLGTVIQIIRVQFGTDKATGTGTIFEIWSSVGVWSSVCTAAGE